VLRAPGTDRVTVRVGREGNSCLSRAADDEMEAPDVAKCGADALRERGALPAPSRGCVDASIPIRLVPHPPYAGA
jgi:hypothetical protein